MKNKVMMQKEIVICVCALLILISVYIISLKTDKKDKYETHKAVNSTERVGGLIPYNIKSDLIIEIPEEYFLNLDKNITYEQLVSEIGEPNGTVGSGIVRDYWRIDENKYAVCISWSDKMSCEIWKSNK